MVWVAYAELPPSAAREPLFSQRGAGSYRRLRRCLWFAAPAALLAAGAAVAARGVWRVVPAQSGWASSLDQAEAKQPLWCENAVKPPDLWQPDSTRHKVFVKVLTYNLWWWNLFKKRNGNHGSAGKLIAKTGKPRPYDLMGFQECEDPARVLRDAGLLEEYAPFQGNNTLCMAYRKDSWSLIARGHSVVAEDQKGLFGRRAAQWMRLRHRSGAMLFFVNHHGPLPINTGGICGGVATAHNILQLITAHAHFGDGILLVGDFNANAASPTVQELRKYLLHVYTGHYLSGIDNIFSNVDGLQVVSTNTLQGGGSDHDALNAIVEVGRAPRHPGETSSTTTSTTTTHTTPSPSTTTTTTTTTSKTRTTTLSLASTVTETTVATTTSLDAKTAGKKTTTDGSATVTTAHSAKNTSTHSAEKMSEKVAGATEAPEGGDDGAPSKASAKGATTTEVAVTTRSAAAGVEEVTKVAADDSLEPSAKRENTRDTGAGVAAETPQDELAATKTTTSGGTGKALTSTTVAAAATASPSAEAARVTTTEDDSEALTTRPALTTSEKAGFPRVSASTTTARSSKSSTAAAAAGPWQLPFNLPWPFSHDAATSTTTVTRTPPPATSPSSTTRLVGCDAKCMPDQQLSTTCRATISWYASKRFGGGSGSCNRAFSLVMHQCPGCQGCGRESSCGPGEPG